MGSGSDVGLGFELKPGGHHGEVVGVHAVAEEGGERAVERGEYSLLFRGEQGAHLGLGFGIGLGFRV